MTNKEINKILGDLKVAWKMKQDPDFPVHAIARPRYNCDKANDLTKAILDWFNFSGHYARRISSEGRYRPGTKYRMANGGTIQGQGAWLPGQNNGMADIMSMITGHTIWIEVKIGKDRQSSVQKKFQKDVTEAGAVYVMIKSFSQFLDFISYYE